MKEDAKSAMTDAKWTSEIRKVANEAIDARLSPWKRYVAGFGAGLGVLAVLGIAWPDLRYAVMQKIYPAETVYGYLKESLKKDEETKKRVAQDVLTLLGDRVDSGYSKVIFLAPKTPVVPGQDTLQFYARSTQKVELSIRSQSSQTSQSGTPAHFALTVDNGNIFEREKIGNPELGYAVFGRDITHHLRFDHVSDLEPGLADKIMEMNIHSIRVTPIDLPPTASASFEILILVRNEKI